MVGLSYYGICGSKFHALRFAAGVGVLPAQARGMNISPLSRPLQPKLATAQLIATLQHALDRKYAQMRDAARRQWEQANAGRVDPSDACVSVRIAARPAR